MPTRAAIYCRISRDCQGDLLGVQRQEPPCRELCERLGWEVAEVYTDDDLSAYSGKHRPAYEQMLEDLRAGLVNAIVAWAADRLTRRPVENEAIIDLAERLGVKLATVGGEYDLATPSGRLHFRQLGIIARYESEHRAERLRLKHEELARAGRLHGSGKRPFGYEDDRLTVREPEAALVREAVQRLLAGESVRTVMRDWNARGITTTTGKPWSNSAFVRMLRSPRIAGKRAHHGVVVADAVWPAIVAPAEHEQLLAVLDGKAMAWGPAGTIVRRYLLTGFLVCGRCGAKLIAQPRMDGVRSYACAVGAGRSGCGRTTRLAEPLESYVRDAVITALDTPDFQAALAVAREEVADDVVDGLLDRLRATERRLEDLGRDYADGLVTREAFFAAQARLSDRAGLDLSGSLDCIHWECIKKQVDALFNSVWHYFDNVVVVGPSAVYMSTLWKKSEPDEAWINYALYNFIRALLYIRNIGAEDLLVFAEKPHAWCDHHFTVLLNEIGVQSKESYEQYLDELGAEIERNAKFKTTIDPKAHELAVTCTAPQFFDGPQGQNSEVRAFFL